MKEIDKKENYTNQNFEDIKHIGMLENCNQF